jgi:glutathione S-transferase
MSRRLYQHERSAACRTVRWVLARKRLDYEAVEADAAILAELEGRFESSELPLLEDGSHAVAGTRPIVFYLERSTGPPSVFPSDPQKRNQAVTFAEFAEQAIGTLTTSLERENENRDDALAELRSCLGQVREAIGRRALDSGVCHFGDLAVAAHLVTCQELAELDFTGQYADLAAYVARVRAAAGGV